MVRSSPFEIKSALDDGTATLTVLGELDIATRQQFEDEVDAVVARGARRVVIDLARLSFIDSSGLGLLIVLDENAAAAGWELGLTRPCGQVLSVVELTGADKHLPFLAGPDPS